MQPLTAIAPTRVDFGGGWTDVPPYYEEQGGCVCNLAIARYCIVRLTATEAPQQHPPDAGLHADGALVEAALRRADLSSIQAELSSEFPLGAGLGGSSAAGVAVTGALAAWRGQTLDRRELVEASRRLEVDDLRVPGGWQDHFAAAYGGALGLWFGGDTRVRRIALSAALRAALERRCVVVYTGQSRISGDTISAVVDAYRGRVRRVVDALARMKELAAEMIEALQGGDVDALGALVGDHWAMQRSLHPAIPTPLIDEILARAAAAGAIGGKALGASGGGCVLVVAPEDGAERVRAVVESLAQPLSLQVDEGGFRLGEPVGAAFTRAPSGRRGTR